MTIHNDAKQPASATGEKGEGNYAAAREFQQEQHLFAKDKGRVKQAAREAADALDGPDAAVLQAAEHETATRGQ